MTEPPPQLPNGLTDARGLLFAALKRTMAAVGWTDRADELPPRNYVPPWGWVDAPSLGVIQQPNVPAGTIAATFPVLVAVDGATREQVTQLDGLLAHGWTQLDAVDRAKVLTAGPQALETPSGQEFRAVVFSVQVTLRPRTLCSDPITASHQPDPAP